MFLPGRDPPEIAYAVSPREAYDEFPPPASADTRHYPTMAELCIFYALQIIGGQIGFPLVLFVIAIRRTTLPGIRHPIFLNFYVTWIISSLSFCLLLYTGTQSHPEPPWSLCATQAILVYCLPVLTGSALWAIVFHLWLSVCCVLQNKRFHRHCDIWLVAVPYLLTIVLATCPIVLAIRQPDLVGPSEAGFYCVVRDHGMVVVVAITLLLLLLVTTTFEILVGIELWKNRFSFRTVRVQGWKSVQLFARLGIFHVYSLLVLVTCVEALIAPQRVERVFLQASLPTVAFLVFGTRPDLFQRSSTTTHVERNGHCHHDSTHPTASSTCIEGNPETSRPRSLFSTISQSIWPLEAHKGSPSQARIRGSHSNSYTLQAPLRTDADKSQISSRTNSKDHSYTPHDSIKNKTIKNTPLGTIPQSPLDESSRSQDFPPTLNTSPIPLHPDPLSLTVEQQEPHNSQLVIHQLSENRPIRPLPTPPGVGEVPTYKGRVTRQHAPVYEVLQGKSGSRESNRTRASVAHIEVHTETSYHYDPPLTSSGPTVHRRHKSIGF